MDFPASNLDAHNQVASLIDFVHLATNGYVIPWKLIRFFLLFIGMQQHFLGDRCPSQDFPRNEKMIIGSRNKNVTNSQIVLI